MTRLTVTPCMILLAVVCLQHATFAAFHFRRARQTPDGLDLPQLRAEQDINASGYDVLVVITDSVGSLVGPLRGLFNELEDYISADKTFGSSPSLAVTKAYKYKAGSIIYMNLGSIDRDIVDDVRRFEDAGESALKKVIAAGKQRPLLIVPKTAGGEYDTDLLLTVMGALQAIYVPVELREIGRTTPIQYLGVWGADDSVLRHTLRLACALEKGRIVMRDICASDPERMSPPKVEAYLRKVFNSSYDISMNVISDQAILEREYPLMAAVNRGSHLVERYKGRYITMEYTGSGTTNKTLFMLGKGITFDTGGINLKYNSYGMHRDKCGAAVVAGFMKILSILKPANLKVMGGLPMVKNSIGEEAYTTDEIITARSGARVRIGNTDAEGRLILADTLCHMKELAVQAVNPHLFTIATLTGHAKRTSGLHYSIVMDNGPARAMGTAQQLSDIGDNYGDPLEISRLRREDFQSHVSTSIYEDLINIRGISSSTPRGHQTPMAFLMQVSGLHPLHSSSNSYNPLPFTHIDIAGPSLVYPGVPTGSPLVALAAEYILTPDDKSRLVRGVKADDERKIRERQERDMKLQGPITWQGRMGW